MLVGTGDFRLGDPRLGVELGLGVELEDPSRLGLCMLKNVYPIVPFYL